MKVKLAVMVAGWCLLAACTPRVEVAMPDKPITINLNGKIEHEVRVRVEKDLENLFEQQDGIF